MAKNESKARFWTILVVVNLLTLAYPLNMLIRPDSEDGTIVGVVALLIAGLLLGVADMISVALAYSMSY
jgi:hypothetical protein